MGLLTAEDVERGCAAVRSSTIVRRTPLLDLGATALPNVNAHVLLKLESLQATVRPRAVGRTC